MDIVFFLYVIIIAFVIGYFWRGRSTPSDKFRPKVFIDKDGDLEIKIYKNEVYVNTKYVSIDFDSWKSIGRIKGYISGASPNFKDARKGWWTILKVSQSASKAQIEAAYRNLAKKYHPDTSTGSVKLMAELNVAKQEAMKRFQ